MAKAEIVVATAEHVAELAETMRQADRDEIRAASMQEPLAALTNGLRASTHAWAGLLDGEVACIFGVAPISLMGGNGSVWLLGSDLIDQHPKHFLRRCRRQLAVMARGYSLLQNYVDDRNKKSIAWLEWLGFTIEEPVPHGIAGLPFRHFYLRTDHV